MHSAFWGSCYGEDKEITLSKINERKKGSYRSNRCRILEIDFTLEKL